jgi:hypothetical protein
MSLDHECRWHEERLASSGPTVIRRARSAAEPTRHANSGGPITRRRTERVLVSVLRDDASRLHLPRTLRAGLRFGRADPLSRVLAALARVGLDDPEQLRARYTAPLHPLLCRVVPNAPWAEDISSLPDSTLLEHALLLGLCTAYQYDPARPVLWTRASLTRCVELHEPAGFYA